MRHSIITAIAMLSLAFSSAALAQSSPQDVVNDKGKGVITNTFGNCVRTRWQSANDVCAPEKPAPVVQKIAQPAPPPPVISRDARTVYFDFDDASLSAEATQKLDNLAAIVAQSKGIVSASVVGYADKIGNSDYNVTLSQKRAGAVKQYLDTKINIPTSVAEVQGLGSIQTPSQCDAIKNREEKIGCLAQDRRVEVQFQYQQ